MNAVPIAGGVAARASRAPRAAWAGWLLVALAGVLAVLALRSAAAAAAAAAPSVCALRDLAGLACPTCGFTRASVALAHGDWRGSLALHPGALALAAQLLVGWLAAGAWLAGALRSRPDRWIPHVVALDVAALVLLWALRATTGALPG